MIKQLAKWSGRVDINGVNYAGVEDIPSTVTLDNTTVITLIPRQTIQEVKEAVEHIITVKQYMTQPATPEFDFIKHWNNNIPMPMCTMVGTVEKETQGMVYMHLHGELIAERMFTCMYCGRPLTNPVSQFFGCGPECSGHGYMLPENYTMEQLKAEVDAYKKKLLNVKWSGWIIKSAIKEDILKNSQN